MTTTSKVILTACLSIIAVGGIHTNGFAPATLEESAAPTVAPETLALAHENTSPRPAERVNVIPDVPVFSAETDISAPAPDNLTYDTATVAEWVDGDTLVLVAGERVRLVGMDAPEISTCAGEDARDHAENLAPAGSEVWLLDPEPTPNRDMYDRLLRYVVVPGAWQVDVGTSLIVKGLGDARYDSRDGYSYHPWEEEYRALDGPNQDGLCENRGDKNEEDGYDRADDDHDGHVTAYERAYSAYRDAKEEYGYDSPETDAAYAEVQRISAEMYDSGSGGGGDFNVPGWACPTRWC